MWKSPKSLILLVLMFAHAVSDLQTNFHISDSNSTTPLLKVRINEQSNNGNSSSFQEQDPSAGWTNPRGGQDFGSNPTTSTRSQGSSSGFTEYADPRRTVPEKQKTSQPKLPDAQLSSCNDSTLSDIHVNSSHCNDSSRNLTFRGGDDGREISEEAERFITGFVSTVFIPSFYTLVFIISVPLNICALLVFVLRVKPKKAASIYMMNLACADLLFAASLPFKIFYRFNGNDWIFGSPMCSLVSAAFLWNLYCSVLLIACISVDRFLVVVYPVSSLTWRSPRKSVIVCVIMWALSSPLMILPLLGEHLHPLETLNITTCADFYPSEPFESIDVFGLVLLCLFFFLPFIITTVSYTLVIVTLSKAQPGFPGHARKKRRAVVLASIVLMMFLICFTPTNCLYTVEMVVDSNHSESLAFVSWVFLCLGSVNCILDPLVYYFGSSQFRKELFSMLGCNKSTQGTSSVQSPSYPSTSTSQIPVRSNTSPVNGDSSQANLV